MAKPTLLLGTIIYLGFGFGFVLGPRIEEKERKSEALPNINLDLIESSVRNVKTSYKEIIKSVEVENKKLNENIDQLLAELRNKSEELERLNEEVISLEEKSEHYEELLKLDERQVKSINRALRRGKPAEYLFTFISGFIISWFFFALNNRRRNNIKQEQFSLTEK